MTNLIRSELLRIWSRRVVRVLAILATLGIAVGVTIAAFNSRPSSPLYLLSLPDILKGTAFILIVFGLVIGASSVGADWQTGTMAALLTWEPRRVRVFLTRAGVVIASVFVLAIGLQVVLSLAIAAAASLRGSTVHTGSAWLRDVVGTALRVGGAAVLGAALGVTIAMIGRNTTAALGAVFGYLAIVENLLRGLMPKIGNALLSTNLVVFVAGREGASQIAPITVGRAATTMAIYAGVLLVIALVMFRTRDVT